MRTRPPLLPPHFFFFFCPWIPTSLLISPLLSPHSTQGRAEMRVSVVWLSSSETLAKLSVLSANFTTCDKLKAVMWKRCLPLFFPFLSSPLSFHSVVYTLDFVSFPSSDLLHPLLFPLYSPCVSSTFLKGVYVWGRLRGFRCSWMRLAEAVKCSPHRWCADSMVDTFEGFLMMICSWRCKNTNLFTM